MSDPPRPDIRGDATDEADERRERLSERPRAACIEGAEQDSLRRLGRGLSRDELERVLRHYPGDV